MMCLSELVFRGCSLESTFSVLDDKMREAAPRGDQSTRAGQFFWWLWCMPASGLDGGNRVAKVDWDSAGGGKEWAKKKI